MIPSERKSKKKLRRKLALVADLAERRRAKALVLQVLVEASVLQVSAEDLALISAMRRLRLSKAEKKASTHSLQMEQRQSAKNLAGLQMKRLSQRTLTNLTVSFLQTELLLQMMSTLCMT